MRRSETPGSISTATLAGELAGARDADEAIRIALRLFARRGPTRLAAYLADDRSGMLRLAGTRGIGRTAHAQLAAATAIPSDPSATQLRLTARSFDVITGTTHASAVRAGRAIVLAGDVPSRYEEAVQVIAAMLGATLDRLAREDERARDLDLGLAMTAHELREPILGARIVLDRVVHGSDSHDLGLLRQTERELAGLSAKIDGLLRWSVGSAPLQVMRTDLAQVARDAVGLAARVHGHGRVSLRAPQRVPVRADPIQLRSAIENVVRNALVHAPAPSPVDVRVYETKVGRPTVTVRDRGPGSLPRSGCWSSTRSSAARRRRRGMATASASSWRRGSWTHTGATSPSGRHRTASGPSSD